MNTIRKERSDTLQQAVIKLRSMVLELRDENAALEEEVARLRAKIKRLKDPNRTTLDGSPVYSLDGLFDEDAPELEDLMLEELLATKDPAPRAKVMRPSTSRGAGSRRRTPLTETSRLQDAEMAIYQQGSGKRSDAPASRYYGVGSSPEESRRRGLEPTERMSRPNIDLGYINDVDPEQLDSLPYGLIVLDADGRVLFYNETESEFAGYDREQVLGKNFFEDVAPCTRVKEFQGRFRDFIAGKLGAVTFFDFAFHFEAGTQNVVIGLSQGRRKGHYNVMLTRQ